MGGLCSGGGDGSQMGATLKDIEVLRSELKASVTQETLALEQQRSLCMLTNQFNGLIEPASSYKTTDISNGVQKYMDDMEEMVEERIKRVRQPLF